MTSVHRADEEDFLRRLHERPHRNVEEWLEAPAHVHHVAYRMANPPLDRPKSREEFQHLLTCLDIPPTAAVVHDKFGYGVKTDAGGDRLVVVWEAHTEYYSYQVWHVPSDHTKPLAFGPLVLPNYLFPLSPLGLRVNALDILITGEPQPAFQIVRGLMPGPTVYGSRIFGDAVAVTTTFTPDEHGRERYLVAGPSLQAPTTRLMQVVDAIVKIETYYHLILMQKPTFAVAVDEVYTFEQRHLKQREVISAQISTATSLSLQKWLNALTYDLMSVNRLAGRMYYELSAAVPYDKIVHRTMQSLQEEALPPHPLLSDYLVGGVTGAAEGYQQLLRRIETLRNGFEGIIGIIRARIDLLLESQNLSLLSSVDQTTKSQALLQYTVEGLSIIVIAYYLSGLGGYLFKGLHEVGWLHHPAAWTAGFVPVAIALSFALTTLSRKIIHRRLFKKGD
ncbi:DUF3422 family protein [Candidatus Nitrospira bockiana]